MDHQTPAEQAEQEEAERVAREAERRESIARKRTITDTLDVIYASEKLLRGALLKTPEAQDVDKEQAVALLGHAIEELGSNR